MCELGGTSELANYGEYSGAPSEQQTYDYARTLLSLMTRHPHKDGKKLIIGGGIANFTNVATTFKAGLRILRFLKKRNNFKNIKNSNETYTFDLWLRL